MDAVNGLELYEIDEQRQIDKRCGVWFAEPGSAH
jgi:hypothetical protein